ncbi:MAG: alpha/beta fold hydrolase [Bacteroidota bacterium]|nr:alpha/beta fold hydrolase [Bacteroidota bacterium]
MKQILFIFFFLFSFSSLFSQNLTGNWKGNIEISSLQLPIIFHFYEDSTGKMDGNWDSPAQKAMGLSFSGIKFNEDSVHFDIKMINGSYEGKFIGNDSMAGIWHQGGKQITLNFARSSGQIESETAAPLHPGEKEIAITSAGGSKLYGTLLSKNHHQKLAIIIAGSGPTDRDGNNPLGDKSDSYKLLAWALDSQNIATFRYDKRGVAKSTFSTINESNLVFDDYIKDAEKIFDYLHDTLGFKDIYFIGHSEGSLIGMIASQKKKVKGYVSIAGAGRPIDVLIEEQLNRQPLPDSLNDKIHFIFSELKEGKEVDGLPSSLDFIFRKSIQPYMISWLKYSPEKEINKLTCPVLILQGTCDIQVKEEDAQNLHKGNKKSILEIIPLMTHTLKDAGKNCTNQQKTYTDSSLPLNRLLIDDLVRFIKK